MALINGPAQYQLQGGEVIVNVHPQDLCAGGPCAVHNPSDHPMKEFRQHWRNDRAMMERICPHGVGHPDIDDYRIRNGLDSGIHGCCQEHCCRP
jgi:hypothetical protein